jgi:hypothetical protein
MKKPEFKLLPCIFCTIGFNSFVAGHRIISTSYKALSGNKTSLETPQLEDANKSS